MEVFQNNRNLHKEIKSRQQFTNTQQPPLPTTYLLTPMSALVYVTEHSTASLAMVTTDL